MKGKEESEEKEFKTEERSAMITHSKLFDVKRVVNHVGYCEKDDFENIKSAFRALV